MKNKEKFYVMMCYSPSEYEIFETRLKKPISIVRPKDPPVDFALVFQESANLNIKGKNDLEYFVPNNIALLLSTSTKALNKARYIYKHHLTPNIAKNGYKDNETNVSFLKRKSSHFCDYVENIQTGIVFSYTAVEAFVNISIPGNYQYRAKDKKGVMYDKYGIERWVSLREKIEAILTDIYKTKSTKDDAIWNEFLKLESLRHDIIHQKSTNYSEFIKEYFVDSIYDICNSAEGIIRFFYDKHNEQNRTNPLWPWLIGKEKDFPVKLDTWDNWTPDEFKKK